MYVLSSAVRSTCQFVTVCDVSRAINFQSQTLFSPLMVHLCLSVTGVIEVYRKMGSAPFTEEDEQVRVARSTDLFSNVTVSLLNKRARPFSCYILPICMTSI